MKIFPSDFEITEFFPYPSVILYDIASYDDIWNKGKGDPWVKDFFEHILNMAEMVHNTKFMDNKIAFHIVHKKVPGSSLYVGYINGIYKIGLSARNIDDINPIDLTILNNNQ